MPSVETRNAGRVVSNESTDTPGLLRTIHTGSASWDHPNWRVQHEFWQTLITNSSGTARKLWNSLSSVMGRNQCSSTTSSGLTADSFTKFICDKVNDVQFSTAGAADPEYAAFQGYPLDEFAQLSISDVERQIKDSPTKACGLDPIPTWLVKEFVQHLAPFLTCLFNRLLLQGQFSENFC